MAAVLLLAMGYEVLSMNATSLPRVKRVIRAITASEAEALLAEVLQMDSAQQIEARLEHFLRERDLQQLVPAVPD
jgi:phosphotransferase system enzyme I (PtsP)